MPTDSTEVADSVEQSFQILESRVHELRPNEDLAPLQKAYRFASERHRGQARARLTGNEEPGGQGGEFQDDGQGQKFGNLVPKFGADGTV